MTISLRDRWLLLLSAEALLLLLVLTAAGVWSGEVTPDTASYFYFQQQADPWGTVRHPGYGWLASWLGAHATGAGLVVIPQALLHVVAPFVLYFGARRGGIGASGAFALATAAMLSQAGFLSVGQVMPESPAMSLLLMAFGATLAASASARSFRRLALPIALLAGAGYLLRPSHLPAIGVIPLLYGLFAWRNGGRVTWRTPLLLLLLGAPFLLQSAVRLKAVGDFNIVSFGGFQMSPVAAFMLTSDIIARLPERMRPTAAGLVAARDGAKKDGAIPTTPLDRSGDRFFITTALGYFDVYARSYDTVLHFGIAKLQRADENFVAFNRRLMEVSVATIMAAPLRWVVWVGGAMARFVGRAIVLNAPMLLALVLFIVATIPAFARRRGFAPGGEDIAAVSVVALGWLASAGVLTVLVTVPGGRYVDTAAALLPAIPLTFMVALLSEKRTPR